MPILLKPRGTHQNNPSATRFPARFDVEAAQGSPGGGGVRIEAWGRDRELPPPRPGQEWMAGPPRRPSAPPCAVGAVFWAPPGRTCGSGGPRRTAPVARTVPEATRLWV